MNELPPHWKLARVGEVIELGPKNECPDDSAVGFVPLRCLGTTFRSRHSFEIRPWSAVKKGYTHFADGDVLLARITPCFENGKAGIVRDLPNGVGAGSTEYFVCRPKAGVLLAEWLLAHFKTQVFLNEGEQVMSGAVGQQRVPKSYLLASELPLPPLDEQRRIAENLDALVARVDSCRVRLDRVASISGRFRETVLAAATSGELTREWRTKHGVDHEWPIVKLENEACEFSYGSAAKSTRNGRVPVLRMGNIQDGLIDWGDLVFTSDAAEIAKYKLSSGDVLFNRTNSPELVGKTAVFRGEREAVYAGYLVRIRCGERLLPDYLNYCLGSPAGREYCWRVKTDGVSQSNINARKLAAFAFRLPRVEEQREIIRRVERLLALSGTLGAKRRRAAVHVEHLSSSLLAKALRGKLFKASQLDGR